MRRTCASSTAGLRSVPRIGGAPSSSSSGMLPRGSTTAATRARAAPIGVRRRAGGAVPAVALDAEQEVGRDQHRLERRPRALLERARPPCAALDQRHQLPTSSRRRPAGGRRAAPGRDDRARARGVVLPAGGRRCRSGAALGATAPSRRRTARPISSVPTRTPFTGTRLGQPRLERFARLAICSASRSAAA